MLNSLIWNYQGEDLKYLAKFDVLTVLQQGDGGRTHPIRLSWGKQIKQKKESEDRTLTRVIANLFEFLFKQILSQVIIVDANREENEKQAVNNDNPCFEAS